MKNSGTEQAFSAELYDGISSVPFTGSVVIEVDEIRFTEISGANEQTVHISYSDILEIITRKDQTRLMIKGGTPNVNPAAPPAVNPPVPDLLMVIHAPGISRIIKKLAVHHSESVHAALLNRFRWMSLKTKIFWLTGFVFFMIVAYLWCLHRVYHFVPIASDQFIGNKIAGLMVGNEGICDNPELQDRLDTLLAAIVPSDSGFEYDITVISNKEMNAFALPGGKIFVFTGLLGNAGSSEEIAGVIAHEIAHVEKRHGIQNLIRAVGIHYIISIALGVGFEDADTIETLSEFADLLIILKYSRDFEYEADIYAADLLHRSGLSVAGLKSFMINIQEQHQSASEEAETGKNRWKDFLNTHPATPERIKSLSQILEKETGRYAVIFEEDVDWKRLSALCWASGDGDDLL